MTERASNRGGIRTLGTLSREAQSTPLPPCHFTLWRRSYYERLPATTQGSRCVDHFETRVELPQGIDDLAAVGALIRRNATGDQRAPGRPRSLLLHRADNVFLDTHRILTVRPEPHSDLQGLGVFNCSAIERRGRFRGQSRCDDKGDKRADGAQQHCRNEGRKGGVIRERQSRAGGACEGVLQDTQQRGD
jgi:hypothetical protein